MIFASRGTRGVTNTLETYQYLENLGIEPNITTNNGVTPLHSIAYRGKDLGIFNYFLSKGVDVNQADDNGNTPFTNAALLNKLNIVQHLSSNVRNINAADKEGRTALTNALRRNTSDVVNFLLIKGADIDILDKKGNHLGYYLIQSYNPNKKEEFELKAKLLTDHGFKINKSQKDKNTLFHFGVDKEDITLLRWIHSKGINVNTKNTDGLSPLQKAAMSAKNDQILKYLISIGADKSVKTDFDESVYDLASENELLQKNNIDIQFLK